MMERNSIKVLFVDDDITLGSMVTQGLSYLGYRVHYQSSMTALDSIINEFRPNIIILDVEIGDKDGIDDSQKIRTLFPNIPIIFASSHIEASYVVRALDAGATTYLKKPLDIEEVAAYINRYATPKGSSNIAIGIFSLDTATRVLQNSENSSDATTLNKKECELLQLLHENTGLVVSREMIIERIWNNDFSSDQVLNNYISRLRKYLAADVTISIETVPREGYRLDL